MKAAEEQILLDDIAYELAVRSESGGHYGTWFCKKCRIGGVKYELLPSISAAIEHAGVGAAAHHMDTHRPPAKPTP